MAKKITVTKYLPGITGCHECYLREIQDLAGKKSQWAVNASAIFCVHPETERLNKRMRTEQYSKSKTFHPDCPLDDDEVQVKELKWIKADFMRNGEKIIAFTGCGMYAYFIAKDKKHGYFPMQGALKSTYWVGRFSKTEAEAKTTVQSRFSKLINGHLTLKK